MNNDVGLRHLTSEQIQDLLDQNLPPQEEGRVQEHLAVCPRCRSEVESWQTLFSGLGALPALTPSPAFSREILEQLPVRKPLAARIRSWLPGGDGAPAPAGGHLPPERIQDYLEGLLPSRLAARARAHLGACESCRNEAGAWERVFGSLGTLERFEPSSGFAQEVMARVSLPAPVTVGRRKLATLPVLARLRGLLPVTKRGWAVAGGIASAPTITVVALLYQLFSRPLLSPGTFATYASWKVTALVGQFFGLASDSFLESVALFRAYSLVETLSGTPMLVGMGGLGFSCLSAAALWVLYKNLLTTPPGEGQHARVRM